MARKRRGRHEGSIFQRKDGWWVASFTIAVDENGKRTRKTVYGKTKTEVKEKLSRLQHQKLEGTLVSAQKMTLGAFLLRWLEDVVRPKARHATYVSYEGIIRLHISPTIGGIRIDRISAADIQGLYSALERKGASSSIRRLCHAVLRMALKMAVKWRNAPRNVCNDVEAPSIDKRDIKPLDGEQVAKLFNAAQGERLEAIYVVAVSTGMRLGELLGLHWPDVDFENGVVIVRQALSEAGKRFAIGEPKTVKSRRRIELPEFAIAALRDHRKRMIAEDMPATGHVFCNRRGGPIRRSNFHRQQFKPLLTKAGLPSIRFHDLRHTHATLLLRNGTHIKIAQERLGHSSIKLTLDTYSHVLPGMQRAEADKFDAMLKSDAAKFKASERAAKRAEKRKKATAKAV